MEISVVIPVYNKQEYLERCFESIIQQDFYSFEIVAVDDGSTDGSAELCDRWAERDGRLRVLHIANSGVTAARRHGVENSRGQYIVFADADDCLLPGALTILHTAITESKADEVIATYDDQYGRRHDSGWRGFQPCRQLVCDLLAVRNSFCVLWGIIFRKDILEGCLDAPRQIVEREDSLMQIKCLMRKPRVFFIADAVYLHYEDVPNQRVEDLNMIRIYDNELRATLQPSWAEYRSAFVGHQIKVYEKFIDKRQFHVFREYYRPLRRQLSSDIPLMDRIALLLPPRISYLIVYTYKKLLKLVKR
mgnify:CR=1 FL=1